MDKVKEKAAREEKYLDSLFKQADEGYNKFPEVIFKDVFLDYFNGTKELTIEIRNQWLDIAGQLTLPVELIDNDGKVVAIVPPLSNPKANTLMQQHVMNATLMDISIANSSHPALLENVLQKGIVNKISNPKANVEFKNEWATFLNRYPKQTPINNKKQSNVDYDFEINDD